MTAHDFYFTEILNYSSKSIQVIFGFTNGKGIQKESNVWWVPKIFIRAVKFDESIITIAHHFLKLNGFLWRYQTHKAFKRPKKVNIAINSFYGDSHMNSGYLDNIKLIWTQDIYDRSGIVCGKCQDLLEENVLFSSNIKCQDCNSEREALLLDKHVMGF